MLLNLSFVPDGAVPAQQLDDLLAFLKEDKRLGFEISDDKAVEIYCFASDVSAIQRDMEALFPYRFNGSTEITLDLGSFESTSVAEPSLGAFVDVAIVQQRDFIIIIAKTKLANLLRRIKNISEPQCLGIFVYFTMGGYKTTLVESLTLSGIKHETLV